MCILIGVNWKHEIFCLKSCEIGSCDFLSMAVAFVCLCSTCQYVRNLVRARRHCTSMYVQVSDHILHTATSSDDVAFYCRFSSYRFVCQRFPYYWSLFPFISSCCTSFVVKLSSAREERGGSNTNSCNCLESNWLWALIRLSRVVDVGLLFVCMHSTAHQLGRCLTRVGKCWVAPHSHFADLRIDSDIAIQQTWVKSVKLFLFLTLQTNTLSQKLSSSKPELLREYKSVWGGASHFVLV